MIALLGGAFDPPHDGHVALARAAVERFRPEQLVVVVAADPGHKQVELDAETRLRLAEAAFPEYDVEVDDHEWTVDLLRTGRWRDPLFVIGADQFGDFLSWKEPDEVLERAHLAVATRPGYPRERLESVLDGLSRPERVRFFEIPAIEVSSSDVRRRVAEGEPIGGLVPPGVARLVAELGLYRKNGLH